MDWTYINTLLSVIHQASAAGPKFTKWAQAAAEELEAQWGVPPEEVIEPEPAPIDDEAPAPAGRRV